MNLLYFTLYASKYFFKLVLIRLILIKVLLGHLYERNDASCYLVNVALLKH